MKSGLLKIGLAVAFWSFCITAFSQKVYVYSINRTAISGVKATYKYQPYKEQKKAD